ncbi:MAG: hypothetical protein KatS3mg102_2031 [Planctomycetota bacterium]|nr:MAG: hypothetical protein KatS3mg102_2031 [Planctomycetota bacterium]
MSERSLRGSVGTRAAGAPGSGAAAVARRQVVRSEAGKAGRLLGCRASAAVAVALGLVLPAAAARASAERDLKRALAAGDKAAIVAAIHKLGEQDDRAAAETILKVALSADQLHKGFTPKDTNEIFAAATEALAGMQDAGAREYMARNVERHRDPRVRLVLVEVLGTRADAEAEQALIGALDDQHAAVAGLAARILGAKKSVAAVEPLIEQLARHERHRREPFEDVLQALVMITGQDLAKASDWRAWWDGAKATFKPPAGSPRPGVSTTVVREAPKLFGQEILSSRPVFVLDTSKSMLLKDPVDESGRRQKWVPPEDPNYGNVPDEYMRMARLKQAMVQVIKELPEDTMFSIVTFATDTKVWKPKLVRANAANKADAIDFVQGMTPEGYTAIDDGLEKAFGFAEATAFYVFSDGAPQRAGAGGKPEHIPPEEILEKVRQWNRLRKVKIFTIGLGEANVSFMTRLAQEHGGRYTHVQ